jgi:hypothetical protein
VGGLLALYEPLDAAFARRGFFPPASILVETYGNVMAAMALLQGLAVADLSGTELDAHDPDYEVTIGIKAVKP